MRLLRKLFPKIYYKPTGINGVYKLYMSPFPNFTYDIIERFINEEKDYLIFVYNHPNYKYILSKKILPKDPKEIITGITAKL